MTNLKLSRGHAEHRSGDGASHHRRGVMCPPGYLGTAECKTYGFIYGWRHPKRIPGSAVHNVLICRPLGGFFFLHKEGHK